MPKLTESPGLDIESSHDSKHLRKAEQSLLDLIHFTEQLSAHIHHLRNESAIFSTIIEEFKKTKRFTASIVLLTEDGKGLRVARSSLPPKIISKGERAFALRMNNYAIDLKKSLIYRKVVQDGLTVQVRVSDIIAQLFPKPVAYAICEITGYTKKMCIITPLKKSGRIIGAFAMSSTEMGASLIPSVRYFAEHLSAALELAEERGERARAEEALRVSQELLEAEQRALEAKNVALKEILQQIGSEKRIIEAHFANNVERVLLPIIEKLKKRTTTLETEYLNLLERNLKEIASPFLAKLSVKYSRLTPRELEVCNMIKSGLSSKEIAVLLNISALTVHRYREFIRRKLGITNKDVGLTTYLNTEEMG